MPPQGLHLTMRHSVNTRALGTPNVSTACLLYSEQLGTKRQDLGISGLMPSWYALMSQRPTAVSTRLLWPSGCLSI